MGIVRSAPAGRTEPGRTDAGFGAAARVSLADVDVGCGRSRGAGGSALRCSPSSSSSVGIDGGITTGFGAGGDGGGGGAGSATGDFGGSARVEIGADAFSPDFESDVSAAMPPWRVPVADVGIFGGGAGFFTTADLFAPLTSAGFGLLCGPLSGACAGATFEPLESAGFAGTFAGALAADGGTLRGAVATPMRGAAGAFGTTGIGAGFSFGAPGWMLSAICAAIFSSTVGGGAERCASDPSPRMAKTCPHLRHAMRIVLPRIFSSAIEYFDLQLSQTKRMRGRPGGVGGRRQRAASHE
jgi:hypothetical protein